MGNRITRTVLFAASALLSKSAFCAGAARFGTLRNSDWVVTNAWQAVSNRTHDLILEIGQGGSLPPDWQNVSNAAMNAVQSLQPSTNYTDEVALDFEEGRRTANLADNSTFSQIATTLGDTDVAYTAQDLINESTNAAVAVADTKISTNNEAFVSAVLAAPLVGADPSDLSEISEYGSYGTIGAALLALIAGLAALKRRMASAETAINGKANSTDLPYALVTPGEWEFSGIDQDEYEVSDPEWDSNIGNWSLKCVSKTSLIEYYYQAEGTPQDLTIVFPTGIDGPITATRPSLPGHLCDRAVNAVSVTDTTTLTLPALVNAGKARDFIVRLAISGSTVPTITFAAPTGETIAYETDGDEFPVPDAEGTWLYSFTETEAHTFIVSLKKVSLVTQGGS